MSDLEEFIRFVAGMVFLLAALGLTAIGLLWVALKIFGVIP